MATSKLYPTLSKFYEDRYIGLSTDLDNDCVSVPEERLYRKDVRQDYTANNVSTQEINKRNNINKQRNNLKGGKSPLYPRLTENTSSSKFDNRDGSQKCGLRISQETTPSAPPIELLDEDLLRFLENTIQDQELGFPLDETAADDETPIADYTSLTIPTNAFFDSTWVDDLQPDYDISLDNLDVDFLNNLNKKDIKMSKDKSLNLEINIEHFTLNGKRPGDSNKKEAYSYHKVKETTDRNVVISAHGPAGDGVRKEVLHDEKDNRTAVTEPVTPGRPSPGSPEYSAWMTWRKQVNRQLATVILLRRGGQVKLQKADMSRKHLNQRSIDFVSSVLKSGNKTSLGAKPFVMYGIPRASLSGSQRELNSSQHCPQTE